MSFIQVVLHREVPLYGDYLYNNCMCTSCVIGFSEGVVSGVGVHSYQVVETILCYRLN